MTNAEFAATLEKLAVKYRENGALPQVSLTYYLYNKDNLRAAIKGFGGKWERILPREDGDTLDFRSVDMPGLRLWIHRTAVCRRTVTYDCDPIMSPEEEAEILV